MSSTMRSIDSLELFLLLAVSVAVFLFKKNGLNVQVSGDINSCFSCGALYIDVSIRTRCSRGLNAERGGGFLHHSLPLMDYPQLTY